MTSISSASGAAATVLPTPSSSTVPAIELVKEVYKKVSSTWSSTVIIGTQTFLMRTTVYVITYSTDNMTMVIPIKEVESYVWKDSSYHLIHSAKQQIT